MKVLLLLSNIRYGGANKVMVELGNYLAEREYQVCFITYGSDQCFYSYDHRIGRIFIKTKLDGIKKVRRLAQVLELRKILKRENADIIITFENLAKLMAVLAVRFTKCKVLISERMDPYNYRPNRKKALYFRYELADGCVFQTEKASEYFSKRVRKKSKVIPNFNMVNKADWVEWNNRKDEIAFVGRFSVKQKRQDIMLEAFKDIIPQFPEMKLIFYGDGPDLERMQAYAGSLGIADNVVFAGVASNIPELIKCSKLFVLTSDYEGIPNALMEAMMIGIPSISTNCSPGGARLLIQNEVNGYLVPCGDVEALSSAIINAISNPHIAEKYAICAQKSLERFSKSRILPQWEEYLNKVLES